MIARGDVEALASHLVGIGEVNRHRWDDADEGAVVDLLRAMPVRERSRLAAVLTRSGSDRTLPGLITRGLAKAAEIEERREKLEQYGSQYVTHWPETLVAMVDAERAAGHRIPDAVVAVVRRTAAVSYWPGSPLVDACTTLTLPVLNCGEAWADAALARAAAVGPEWEGLLLPALTAVAARPTAKWEREAQALIDGIGTEQVRPAVVAWLALAGRPRTQPYAGQDAVHNGGYDPYNATALRGLTWLVPLLPPHPDSARVLGSLVETALRRVPGTGPRGPKVANAAVLAPARGGREDTLAELARLGAHVTYKATLKHIEVALEAQAEARGLCREDIEELAVPGYGLGDPGQGVTYRLGGTTVELAIDGARAMLTWRNAAGKVLKGAPATVRRDHAEELTRLRATAKDIEKMLSAQAERMDRQFAHRRAWPYAAWRAPWPAWRAGPGTTSCAGSPGASITRSAAGRSRTR
ncbi:DUF4132 domain-containing protein [Streptomyces sp. NPDC002574]|uniref:DUF4132 domain-containing protein n=1 Tax=Streptomyces sp. NPDC002574 TaxID=3364652 RepID=UPI0036810B55